MKTNIVIVVVLVVLGASVSYRSFSENKFDERNYQSIVEIIEQLSLKDKDINTLIVKSRFGLDQNYDELVSASTQLREQANVLERKMIEQKLFSLGIGIQDYWGTYEKYLAEKLDAIESFKGNNSILRNSVSYAPEAGDRVIKAMKEFEVAALEDTISGINRNLYKYVVSGNRRYIDGIKSDMSDLSSSIGSIENQNTKRAFKEYLKHLNVIIEKQEDTSSYMGQAVNSHNFETLMIIKKIYDGYYKDSLLEQKNKLSSLKLYNFALFSVLLIFALWIFGRQRAIKLAS